jgi:hypothetical protein
LGRCYLRDPEYAWLRGRLERSEGGTDWIFRYISEEEQQDKHVGTVVLAGKKLSLLKEGHYQPGEFVEIEGRFATENPGKNPQYNLTRITRQPDYSHVLRIGLEGTAEVRMGSQVGWKLPPSGR